MPLLKPPRLRCRACFVHLRGETGRPPPVRCEAMLMLVLVTVSLSVAPPPPPLPLIRPQRVPRRCPPNEPPPPGCRRRGAQSSAGPFQRPHRPRPPPLSPSSWPGRGDGETSRGHLVRPPPLDRSMWDERADTGPWRLSCGHLGSRFFPVVLAHAYGLPSSRVVERLTPKRGYGAVRSPRRGRPLTAAGRWVKEGCGHCSLNRLQYIGHATTLHRIASLYLGQGSAVTCNCSLSSLLGDGPSQPPRRLGSHRLASMRGP